MSGFVTTIGKRYLPRGWGDFGRQLAIWFGFLAIYQVARGLAGTVIYRRQLLAAIRRRQSAASPA